MEELPDLLGSKIGPAPFAGRVPERKVDESRAENSLRRIVTGGFGRGENLGTVPDCSRFDDPHADRCGRAEAGRLAGTKKNGAES